MERTMSGKTTYSSNYDFFLENQIVVTETNGYHKATFSSRLEARTFRVLISYPDQLNDQDILKTCMSIHEGLKREYAPLEEVMA